MMMMIMMVMRRFQTSVNTNISADKSCRQLLNADLEELPFLERYQRATGKYHQSVSQLHIRQMFLAYEIVEW